MLRLRNLDVPQSRIDEVRKTGTNPRTLDWPSPADGDVIEKNVINGQRVAAGDELYRIADHSDVWVDRRRGRGRQRLNRCGHARDRDGAGLPDRAAWRARSTFIYPELRRRKRAPSQVRIELPNLDQRMKTSMYADVVFRREGRRRRDRRSGQRDHRQRSTAGRHVAKGEGRFEPRAVKLGRRGDGYAEVTRRACTGRGDRHLGDLPDRRREQSARSAASFRSTGDRNHDRRPHPLVGAQRLSGRTGARSS